MLKEIAKDFPKCSEYKWVDSGYSLDNVMKEKAGWTLLGVYFNDRTETVYFLLGRDQMSTELFGDQEQVA